MGLPIWREPGSDSADNEQKSKADLTAHHGSARSTIRRQNSVRVPNASSRTALHTRLHRSPPPDPPNREIPPIPTPARTFSYDRSYEESRARAYNRSFPDFSVTPDFFLPLDTRGNHTAHASPSPVPDPLPSEYRPRSRRGTLSSHPTALDELPPLRRMGNRRITDSPLPIDNADALSTAPDHLHNPGSSAERSGRDSPESDQWETLLTTITPDPSLPSTNTSFASSAAAAAASFPRATRQSRLPSPPHSSGAMHLPQDTTLHTMRHNSHRSHHPEHDLVHHMLHGPSIVAGAGSPSEGLRAVLDAASNAAVAGAVDLVDAEDEEAARASRVRRQLSQNMFNQRISSSGLAPTADANHRSTEDLYCPIDADQDGHSHTYAHLLDAAHTFHHAYNHLDFSFAEFCEAFSRHERSIEEARMVMRHMSDVSQGLADAHEQRIFTPSDVPARNVHDWRRLFERVLSSAPEMSSPSGRLPGHSTDELANLSDEALNARLQNAVRNHDETARNRAGRSYTQEMAAFQELHSVAHERTMRRLRESSARMAASPRERL